MNRMKRIFCAVLALALLLSAFTATAVQNEADEKFVSTAAHLKELPLHTGSVGGEWLVLGLARAELLDPDAACEYTQISVDYVKSIGSERLHQRKSTDNSRLILALSSLGADPRNVAGYDLTAPLNDFRYVSKQGISGVIWALIALDCCAYPAQNGVRQQLLDAVLAAQHSDGGWGLDEAVSDPDLTGMALQAMSPYRAYDPEVRLAAENGVAFLAGIRQQSGGYASYDGINPESGAQVIVALTALGIDPATDERFVSGGRTIFDSLLRFSVEGGFSHTLGGEYNQMATEQAFYALAAYRRFLAGKTALCDMTDVCDHTLVDADGDGRLTINDATVLQRWLAEFDEKLDTPQKRFADLNHDGRVDIGDVTLCQRLLAS